MTTTHDERGFTLLEALVAMVIIGAIVGIATSQFASYRARGVEAQIASTIRQIATGQEAYYTEHFAYAADVRELRGLELDEIAIVLDAGNSGSLETSFRIHATHPDAERAYAWVSDPALGEPRLSVSTGARRTRA